uniref:MADF domain-containing protein n=1 Tax=Caenorhabditis japonica TaxID=281687 RepID=A0A8R1IMU3_CAEJA
MDSLSFSSESDEDNLFAEHKKEKKIVFGPGENFRKIPESTLALLVKKVEENPCLWEIDHTDYKDTVKNDRIW